MSDYWLLFYAILQAVTGRTAAATAIYDSYVVPFFLLVLPSTPPCLPCLCVCLPLTSAVHHPLSSVTTDVYPTIIYLRDW
jgi:hypothetical protein